MQPAAKRGMAPGTDGCWEPGHKHKKVKSNQDRLPITKDDGESDRSQGRSEYSGNPLDGSGEVRTLKCGSILNRLRKWEWH